MHFPDVQAPRNENQVGKNTFIKLDDGQQIQGVFRGNPTTFLKHWTSKPSVCHGPNCPECKAGDTPKMRFMINFITPETNGSWAVKVFEQSMATYHDLKDLHDSGYNLEKTPVTIKRTGIKQETRYSIIPIPNKTVTPQLESIISKLVLNDLEAMKKPQVKTQSQPAPQGASNPFGLSDEVPEAPLSQNMGESVNPYHDDIPF